LFPPFFYQVPKTYAEEYDDRSSNFILLMEDAYPLLPGDERKGATWQQACSVALRYARFHSIYWSRNLQEVQQDRGLSWHRSYDWMNLPEEITLDLVNKAFPEMMEEKRFSRLVESDMQRDVRLFLQHLPQVVEELKRGPVTFIHADARMENMLWPAPYPEEDKVVKTGMEFDTLHEQKGTKWLSIDWQTSTLGKGVYDLAYFVSLDIDCEEGVGAEADEVLVSKYHEELCRCVARRDGTDVAEVAAMYSKEQCFRDYRLSMWLAALIPIAIMRSESIGDENPERAQAVREAMLTRAVKALKRVQAGEVLRELLVSETKVWLSWLRDEREGRTSKEVERRKGREERKGGWEGGWDVGKEDGSEELMKGENAGKGSQGMQERRMKRRRTGRRRKGM
jgi:thiamine kinase-like enzyme